MPLQGANPTPSFGGFGVRNPHVQVLRTVIIEPEVGRSRRRKGVFKVEVEIGDPDGQRFERLEALVDIGGPVRRGCSPYRDG